MVIDVGDVNDNDPSFDETSYTLDVEEQVGIGSSVGNVTAK